jgi:hypothetical protein
VNLRNFGMFQQRIEFDNIWLTPTPEGLLEQEVFVEFDPKKYGRRKRVLVDKTSEGGVSDETEINKFWLSKTQDNKRIYNKSKFRLACCSKTKNTEKGSVKVLLKVGITDYKVSLKKIRTFREKQTYTSLLNEYNKLLDVTFEHFRIC